MESGNKLLKNFYAIARRIDLTIFVKIDYNVYYLKHKTCLVPVRLQNPLHDFFQGDSQGRGYALTAVLSFE